MCVYIYIYIYAVSVCMCVCAYSENRDVKRCGLFRVYVRTRRDGRGRTHNTRWRQVCIFRGGAVSSGGDKIDGLVKFGIGGTVINDCTNPEN